MCPAYSLGTAYFSFGVAIIDSALTLKSANPQFMNILQASSSDLIGKKIFKFLPEIKETGFPKKQLSGYRIHRENGQTLDLDSIALSERPLAEYAVFCHDNTEYEHILEQCGFLNEQIQINTQMFDKLSDGIFICDSEGQAVYCNQSFCALSGLERETFMRQTIYDSLQQGLIRNSCVALVLQTKEPASAIINYPYGRSCLVSGFPIFINGGLVRAIAIVRDLTELNSLQYQLENEKSLNLTYKSKLQEIESKISGTNVFITHSRAMQNIYDNALRIAPVDCPVFLRGETGVGKDFLAKFIHDNGSTGTKGCLVKVNCGAIPENLLESELFGYEKGAFTGASKDGKAGLFELANNGTIFLDEIGDMPSRLQVKLLNCIQDKKFFRVGGTRLIEFTARIIAATNADLEMLIEQGRFRLDLYYRLNVITLHIPPLRDRRDDILPHALNFLDEFNRKYGKSCYFSPKAMGLLLNYRWPGNVREMRNVIERLVIMSGQDCLEPEAFERNILGKTGGRSVGNGNAQEENCASLKDRMERYEAALIKESLDSCGTLQEAADLLGIGLSTLVRKKSVYGLYKQGTKP